ncbi:MAG: signal peptidase [Pseudomonadota bacterium]|jgi:signal peptidase I
MKKPPNRWLALVLTFFLEPVGFLYVGQPKWAAGIFALSLGLALANYFLGSLPPALLVVLGIVVKVGTAALAWRFATRWNIETPRPGYSRWYGLVAIAGLVVSFIWIIRAFGYEPFNAASESMSPSIPRGTRVVVQKWGYGHYTSFGFGLRGRSLTAPLVHGDIIVFKYPVDHRTDYLFRLIALPGDTVQYRDKQLTVNGTPWPRRKIGEVLNPEWLTYATHFSESNGQQAYLTQVDQKSQPFSIAHVRDFPFRAQCQYDETGFSCKVPAGHYWVMGDNRDNAADSRYWGFVPADHIVGRVVSISK